jgi:hypothetical protein
LVKIKGKGIKKGRNKPKVEKCNGGRTIRKAEDG